MLIFVAGPYSVTDDVGHLANVNAAIDAGLALAGRGHIPYVPHLSHWFDLRAEEMQGARLSWEFYMAMTLAILPRCDALYFVGPSRGANIERAEAERLGVPVYERVEDVPMLAGDPDAAGGGERAGEGGSK